MKKPLCRSKTDKKIFGVCGGIAEYFDIDATIVRLIVAFLTILTANLALGFILYLFCAFILPCNQENKVS